MFSRDSLWEEFFEERCRELVTEFVGKYDCNGEKPSIYINVKKDLALFREGILLRDLLEKPTIAIEVAKEAFKNVVKPYGIELYDLNIRFYNFPKAEAYRKFVKQLNHRYINKFVSVECIVRRVSEPRTHIVEPVFICLECLEEIPAHAGEYIERPKKCPSCKSKNIELSTEKSVFTDIQRIQVQDLPENLESGEAPILLDVYLYDDLVGKIRPGDKVIINGILRLKPAKGNKIKNEIQMYLEANSIEFPSQDVRSIQITERDKEEIKKLAQRPDIYDILVKSLAPSIHGYEDIKLAIVLQLFGGITRVNPDGTKQRGDIHILLVGDPATAKSQFLWAVKNIAPRAIITTGYSSSGVGLTVAATRDEDGRWTLEAGALVLADKGIALIDELEKASKQDRRYLLQSMEQQSISVAKAGITATLNTRCAILACANPKRGRFDRHEPIPDQIDLEPPLLSRFDLIFIVMDEPDEVKDEKVARHILSTRPEDKSPIIDYDLFRKYIVYARQEITNIIIPDEVESILVKYYVDLRRMSKEQGAMAITTRQLEALRRLTEASARVRLSTVATKEDAERAIKIFEACLKQIAIDPETGRLDIDYAISGISASKRDKMAFIIKVVEKYENDTEYGAPEETILEECENKGLERSEVRELLEKLKEKGELYSPRYGYYKVAGYD